MRKICDILFKLLRTTWIYANAINIRAEIVASKDISTEWHPNWLLPGWVFVCFFRNQYMISFRRLWPEMQTLSTAKQTKYAHVVCTVHQSRCARYSLVLWPEVGQWSSCEWSSCLHNVSHDSALPCPWVQWTHIKVGLFGLSSFADHFAQVLSCIDCFKCHTLSYNERKW